MAQLTIQLSDKALALIAQLQKEIFNRRRKKVTASGVVETLVESGAKSQSDKRFATSWKNLIADIEKAAKVADAHGAKPANLTEEEWAMVLSHRTRAPKAAVARPRAAAKATVKKTTARKVAGRKAAVTKAPVAKKALAAKPSSSAKASPAAKAKVSGQRKSTAKAKAPAKATAAAKVVPAGQSAPPKTSTAKSAPASKGRSVKRSGSSSVAKRMAKAVSRLGSATGQALASSNGAAVATTSP